MSDCPFVRIDHQFYGFEMNQDISEDYTSNNESGNNSYIPDTHSEYSNRNFNQGCNE